jgi:hypothetical protein
VTAALAVTPAVTLSSELVARAGTEDAARRVRGCTRPVRLRGSTTVVRRSTGELVRRYSSADELDGHTYLRCGNRRAAVCPSCSHEYKGDAWHLLVCGLAGGKGIPEAVAGHPAVFVTLTAPSFGPVHGLRGNGPCRARRDRPVCPHGRPAWCTARHGVGDPRLGLPLCSDCYDYPAHVVWQWWAPELWRRFTIALGRALAAAAGLTPAELCRVARVNYTKVVEFQARGVVHVHAVVRLDGPHGPDDPAPAALPAAVVESAVHRAAGQVRLLVPLPGAERLALRWGAQVDTRPVDGTAGRDSTGGPAHPRQVAAYLAKYLTKTTEDFGLPGRVLSAGHAAANGATPHAIRLIATAERLAAASPVYALLATRLATLGYRGHPITKSRAYSVTFGALRRARRQHRHQPAAGLAPDAAVRELPADDDPDAADLLVLADWTFDGVGYLTTDRAALAMASAARARAHRWATGT